MTRTTHNHKIDFENITIVDKDTEITIKDCILSQARLSQRNPHAGIEHIRIPEIYKVLF